MLASASRNAARLGLIALMILGALTMWVGSPALWLWIGSQMTESQQGEFGPYVLVAVGILGSTVAVAIFLAKVSRAYERVTGSEATVRVRLPWLRSLRDERSPNPQITVLDLILVTTAVLAIVTLGVWFLLFAGSPLPG
jgi:hypothetical protein